MIELFGKYDELRQHTPYFSSFSSFIVMMGILTCAHSMIVWTKIFLLNLTVRNSNKQIFKDMAYAVMRSSLNYYKRKSSGDILDKYSVDLGSLDSILVYRLQDCTTFFLYLSSTTYLIIYKPILAIPLLLLVVSAYGIYKHCAPAVLAQR